MNPTSVQDEKLEAALVAEKLRTPLRASGDAEKDKLFAKGGYRQNGYGVSAGAAIDGSFAFEGNQGYYAQNGEQIFVGGVEAMKKFFARHRQKGKPIRLVIKTGIGGQHTPFQGIADGFALVDPSAGKVIGEYELGKDFEAAIDAELKTLGAGWDQVAVVPSSKSGSTDETMMIFVQIFAALLKRAAQRQGLDAAAAAKLSGEVLAYLHDLNIAKDGKEKAGGDLFKGFSFADLKSRAGRDVRDLFKEVLGRMFFETTDKPSESRLSAFIRNSGLDKELGEDQPGFGAMFENVGGRWTADLHMMTFLAFYDLDAKAYWTHRRKAIEAIRKGEHAANRIAHRLLDENITDIALLVPEELFWFGKSNEQNFNESIWQAGFANLITVPVSLWASQERHYKNHANRLVINLTGNAVASADFKSELISIPPIAGQTKAGLAQVYADLFSLFYGITNTVGNRLIARAVGAAGCATSHIDLQDLNNPATKVLQENLFLRQPYVELGKGLVDKRFQALQGDERTTAGALGRALSESQTHARERKIRRNIGGPDLPSQPSSTGPHRLDDSTGGRCGDNFPDRLETPAMLEDVVRKAVAYANKAQRKLVPFLYLEGEKFQTLRVALSRLGVEWVLQGTGDQHISYQQVLAQPQRYLPFLVSFVPVSPLPGLPAIGFAKAHLDRISPHLLRDYFAEASFEALTTGEPAAKGGQGFFLRLADTDTERNAFLAAFEKAFAHLD